MTKPLVYNYRRAEDRIAELTEKVKHQAEEVNRLKEENTNLRIRCRILEADLKRLKEDEAV